MRAPIWIMVWVLALFPWWATPITAALVPLPWEEAARVVTATVACAWTPFVLLAAIFISAKASA